MRKRKTKRRTRIGSSARFLLLAGLVLPMSPAALPHPAGAEKHAANSAYVLVAGTVFRDPGFALPGAEVAVSTVLPPDSHQKAKKWKAISDNRGEFALRLPPGSVQYTVSVTCKGFGSDRKTVSVEGQDRVDVTFVLQPESK